MSDKPNFVSRAVQKLTPRRDPERHTDLSPDVRPDGLPHPFDAYYDPDYVPAQDTVTVEHLTPQQADRKAAHLSDAQRAGVQVAAELAAREQLRREVAALKERS